jgi:putative ABC transport system permease protein
MSMTILYLMLKRVIEQDRTQIGTLRAFGYSSYSVLFHYLFYGIVTGLIGGVLGCIGGYFAANAMDDMYAIYFKMPETKAGFMGIYVILGLVLSVGAGAMGSFLGARKILKLLPAEAMRPPAPKVMKNDILSKLTLIRNALSTTGSMAVRSIGRSKLRSLFVVIGIAFSFAMLAFTASYNSMIDVMLMDQYTKVQVYDLKVNFTVPVSETKALSAVYGIDHVTLAEAQIELPAEINNGHRTKAVVLQGIEENSTLHRIYDNDKNVYYPPPASGLIISDSLAKDLEVKEGDRVKISSDYSMEDIYLPVNNIISMNLGSAAFIEANSLREIFHTPNVCTSVILKTSDSPYIKDYLKDASNVSFLEDAQMTLINYQSFMEPYTSIIYVMELISVFVAVAIIYNVSTISLSERQREYATLRVMGMQVKEVSSIMDFEFWLLCFFGVALGFPLTIMLKQMMARMVQVEMFTFPTYTPPMAYITGIIGCVLAVKIANMSASGRIRKLDMVEVLKERE